MNLAHLNVMLKHTWADPRFVAMMDWMREYPDPVSQMLAQIPGGRLAAEQYVETGQWPDDVANREVSVVIHEMPGWDWWEPTSRWRREAARGRELDAKLRALEEEAR